MQTRSLIRSHSSSSLFALAPLVVALALPAVASAKRKKPAEQPPPESSIVQDKSGGAMISGRLEPGDSTLDSGEFFELFTFELVPGQSFTIDLYSSDFDTFLSMIAPSGEAVRNDDFEGAKNHSQIVGVANEAGTWSVAVTSYRPGEVGAFSLQVQLGESVLAAEGPAPGGGGSYQGRLEFGDPTLDGGEYYDLYPMQVSAGQRLTADLRSSEFDTFVSLISPRGDANPNDDYQGSKNHSRVEVVADESGVWQVAVTSYAGGESGAYQLEVVVGDHAPVAPQAGGPAGGEGVERTSGRLEPGDNTLDSGEYVDSGEFVGSAGEFVVFDLRSTDFDPWLELRTPSGETFVNDDHEGDPTRSQLAMALPESGTYIVFVTTYKPGATGGYDLAIRRGGQQPAAESGAHTEQGALADGDDQLDSGEYADTYEFEGRPGQRLKLDLTANGFDGYLVLVPPGGKDPLHNDDAPGQPGHSVIETTLTELGTHIVVVTSYKAGETGSYTLSVEFGEGQSYAPQQDTTPIQPGVPLQGELADGDGVLDGGEYVDLFWFDATAGQNASIELVGTGFDTFVGLLLPSGGEPIQNDDYQGQRDTSRIDLTLQESGRYRIAVTSLQGGETGSYTLTLTLAEGGGAGPLVPAAPQGRIHGVFVGISDYPGDDADLPYTAEDARMLQSAFARGVGMQGGDAVVLTDAEATVEAVGNAVATVGARAGEDDLFVFFYSGHGARQKRDDFTSSDPDGMDETLMLYDGHVTDDQFATMLDSVGAGTTLLVLDACFAGGFAKDVISKPGRMGMFSSEEDVTSGVAAKFRAGGFLARFVADGVGEGYADDGDGRLTALELSQYVHERYRADVKSGGTMEVTDYVRTGRASGYQHLVIDRGSVGPYQVLFALGGK